MLERWIYSCILDLALESSSDLSLASLPVVLLTLRAFLFAWQSNTNAQARARTSRACVGVVLEAGQMPKLFSPALLMC